MQTKRHLSTMFSILLIVALLAACGSPAAVPAATPVPATATPASPTPTSVPPTVTPIPATPTPEAEVVVPEATAEEPAKGRIVEGSITSVALRDNLIGDPATRPYYVYLPPSYDTSDRRYPVVFFLHGYTGRADQWLYFMPPDLLDELIGSGELAEMIVVCADGWTSFGGSWYRNSPVFGEIETYIVEELVQLVDSSFRTLAHRDSRGILGLSMGGEGALHLALAHPDVFGAVASLNGHSNFATESALAPGLQGFDSEPEDFGDMDELGIRTRAYFAWAAIKASNPANPPFFLDSPFYLDGGEARVVPEVWEKLSTAGVVHELDDYLAQPVRLRGILLVNGVADTMVPLEQAQAFDAALTEHKIDHEFRTHPGVHIDLDMTPLLQFMADHLAFEMPEEAITQLDDETVAAIEAIVDTAMTDYPTPGFAMCIVKDGEVVYSKGFGLADVEGNRAMTPNSVSTEYSISKSLAAMAAMQLVEQGKLDLDAPVTDYLPYFAMADPRYQDITVRMLLSHTAGIPDSPYPWDFPLDATVDPLEQAVRALSDQQLLAAPGEEWIYSGWGYSTLGDIIAKVTGQPFSTYMQQTWLEPLGMLSSTFVPDEVDPDLRVTGYISVEDGGTAAVEAACDARDAPACTLWSSCEDMIKVAQLLLNNGELDGVRFLEPSTIEAMWTAEMGTFYPDFVGPWYGPLLADYALGWYVGEKEGHRLAGHTGAAVGYNTQIQLAPDDGLAVIAVNNWLDAEPAWHPASYAAFDVTYLLLGVEP